MYLILLLAQLSAAYLPNSTLTPGVALLLPLRAAAPEKSICDTKWGKDVRVVTERMKTQVFDSYGIPAADRHLYEIDHLISREVGGQDDVKNLWPELWVNNLGGVELGAHRKDHVENAAHRAVCAGVITLEHAQQALATKWTVLIEELHVK